MQMMKRECEDYIDPISTLWQILRAKFWKHLSMAVGFALFFHPSSHNFFSGYGKSSCQSTGLISLNAIANIWTTVQMTHEPNWYRWTESALQWLLSYVISSTGGGWTRPGAMEIRVSHAAAGQRDLHEPHSVMCLKKNWDDFLISDGREPVRGDLLLLLD